jgi:hypothetical protein
MTEKSAELAWLLDSKHKLQGLRQESWLTEPEIAIIDRGISGLDALLFEWLRDTELSAA